MMGNWRSLLWRNLTAHERRLTPTLICVNTFSPLLCCDKTPISFEVVIPPANRIHFVVLLTARCGQCSISCQNAYAEYCVSFWKETENLLSLPVMHKVSKHVKKSPNVRNRHPEGNFEEIETILEQKKMSR